MDPTAILAALGPVALDLVRNVIGRFVGKDGYKPASLAEWLEMRRVDLDLFKAMQDAGGDTGVPWANVALRLQKPALATIVLGVWGYQELFIPSGSTPTVAGFAAAVGFWMFGEAGRDAIRIRQSVGK